MIPDPVLDPVPVQRVDPVDPRLIHPYEEAEVLPDHDHDQNLNPNQSRDQDLDHELSEA